MGCCDFGFLMSQHRWQYSLLLESGLNVTTLTYEYLDIDSSSPPLVLFVLEIRLSVEVRFNVAIFSLDVVTSMAIH